MIIIHISDIHWRGLSRHEEYRDVFGRFFDQCKGISPDLIVVGGDIVHSKTQGISPELIENLNWWFTSLAEIAPTHVVLGNHDGLILNKDRQDAITPILSALRNPRIHLYKKSGTYDSGYPGLKWCVFSCFDEEGWKDVAPDPGSINIALFHGAVWGATTDTDWEVGHDIDASFFKDYDFALLGDIHKFQYLDPEKRIAYPGSTIQQNYGEDPEKGFLVWNIRSKNDFDSRFISLHNDQPYVTIDWAGSTQKTFEIAKRYPERSRFRVRFSENFTHSDVSSLQDRIRKELKPTEIVIKDESTRDTSLISTEKRMVERKSIRDPGVMHGFLTDYIDSTGLKVPEERMRTLSSLLTKYLQRATGEEDVVRDTLWEIKKIQFNNTFAYGEGNEIDFDALSGITGIFGKNRKGKSSIIGTLMYALFNATDRGPMKNLHIINTNKNYCDARVDVVINGENYTAHRITTRTFPKKGPEYGVTQLNFFKGEDTDLSDEQRRETEKVLRRLIGTSEDFLMTSLASQGQINTFISEKATARKSILSKFLDLDIFEKMYDLVREDISPIKSSIKNKSTEDLRGEISRAESDILRVEKEISEIDSRIHGIQDEIEELVAKTAGSAGNSGIEPSSTISARISRIKAEIDDLESDVVNLAAEKESLNLKLEKAKKIKEEFSLEEITRKVETTRSLEKTFETLKGDLRTQQHILETKIKSVSRLDEVPCGDSFPTCKFIKDSHEDKKSLSNQRDVVSSMESRIKEIETKVKEMQGENPEEMLRKYNKVIETERATISQVQIKEAHISAKNQRIQDKRSGLSKETILLNQAIENEAGEDPSRKGLTSRLDDLRVESKSLNEKKVRLATSLGVHTSTRDNAKKGLVDLEAAIDRFETLDVLQDAFSKRGIPLQIMNAQIPTINKEIESILQGVVGFSIELEADLDSNSMDIFINYGDSRRVIELASGMEKMMASLAIRVALTNISSLPKTNMLIIDEGFGTLDDTNIEACTKLLESFKRWFKNIIVISHVDAIKDAVDNVIEINWENNSARVIHG